MKKALLIIVLLLAGCADYVGEEEFTCPICKKSTGRIKGTFDDEPDLLLGFYFYCSSCDLKSGEYTKFSEATKIWKLPETKPDKGEKK